ncbi:MAG: amino acid ABC transporter permease [Oscillospiraceae bacterium]|jgi:L-cystine transport system permease protein|nr:amino acid ABC transporter permease [Oscillospiraceae bacterium]
MSNQPFKAGLIPEYVIKILGAFPTTLILAVAALIIGIAIGACLAAASFSTKKPVRVIASGYIHFIRGIPPLVLIYLLYLGFPQLMKRLGVDMSAVDKKAYMIVIFAIAISAGFSEMMRSSFLAIDKGQTEAALSIGMTKLQAFRRIVFPQAFGVALPSLGNNIIMLIKLTSLGFVIGIVDLMGKARIIITIGYRTRMLEVYLALAVIYWAMCFLLERLNKHLVRVYTKGKKQTQ